MLSTHRIRPFGPLRWILEKLSQADGWSIIGALSAEDRCLTATQELLQLCPDSSGKLLDIMPHPGSVLQETAAHTTASEAKRRANRGPIQTDLASRIEFVDAGSIDRPEGDLNNLIATLAEGCPANAVLDVSTMPKRFFFPLLTVCCESNRIQNLVVANTSPIRYGDVLSGDADDWKPLPLYQADPFDASSEATLIAGVGYQPLKIHDILAGNHSRRVAIKLLFPFPSIHPGSIQNWRFVQHVMEGRRSTETGDNRSSPEIIRVPIGDVSLTFDRLLQQSQAGQVKSLILAPFGPKPISLAMCLLGVARRARGSDPDTGAPILPTAIGYTQPRWYHPDYSTGVSETNGIPDVMAFCVRLNGRDLYSLP